MTLPGNTLPGNIAKALVTLALAIVLTSGLEHRLVQAAEAGASDSAPRYETHVAPLLKQYCGKCHSATTRKAELDLSAAEAIFRGGESGSSVEPGKPDESLLLEMIESELMPPEDEPQLSEPQTTLIRRWIEAGAPLTSGKSAAHLSGPPAVTNHDVEPLLKLRCATCHGLRRQEAGLDLRTKAAMLRGGKSGPALVPGKPRESRILQRIHAGEMPPPGQLVRAGVRPMTESERERLHDWILAGAPEVDVAPDVAGVADDPLVSDEDRKFWSFQSPQRPATPIADDGVELRNPIDAFIWQQLQRRDLKFSPTADRATLLRRLSFDLTGLPPSAEQVQQFVADRDPLAYERMVDRILASPRYGERWARFWLDAAGYADSEGKRSADPVRPHAFRYRDYVIRALNSDKPYSQFLLEQIAGDELVDYERAGRVTPEMAEKLIATGFLRMAPDGTGSDIVNTVAERMEVIADEIDVFGATVLGLTLKCARCHSHKYDPLPQRDYYRLAAVFKGAFDEHDWLKPSFVASQTKDKRPGRVLSYVPENERQAFLAEAAAFDQKIAEKKKQLEAFARQLREQLVNRKLEELPEFQREEAQRLLASNTGDRDDKLRTLGKRFGLELIISDKQVERLAEFQREKKQTDKAIKKLQAERPAEPAIRALWDRGEPSPTYIYRRGDFRQPGRLVGPGVPSVLTDGKSAFEVQPPWPGAQQTGRRLALARWLVESDHPLTARVMVNRIWRHHFGRGIVKSIDNFGKLGDRPSHPLLLDWLAVEFVENGWSIKHLHRLIVTSRTYRQSSRMSPELERADPENVWLARAPLRRLDAEQVRDALVSAAGSLSEQPFGKPDAVDVRKDGLVVSKPRDGGWRRSIYLRQRRKEMPTILETFDLPQMNPACQQRVDSTVAQQALYLLNNSMVRELSERFAERAAAQSADRRRQLAWIHLTALGRLPDEQTFELALESLEQLERQWKDHLTEIGQDASSAERKALAVYCHTMLNSASFVYVD